MPLWLGLCSVGARVSRGTAQGVINNITWVDQNARAVPDKSSSLLASVEVVFDSGDREVFLGSKVMSVCFYLQLFFVHVWYISLYMVCVSGGGPGVGAGDRLSIRSCQHRSGLQAVLRSADGGSDSSSCGLFSW